MSVFDGVRRLLGLRTERSLPAAGPKPRLGARIVRDDVRITVQAGLADATWQWLLEQGWREETFRNSRRRYREVPPSLVAELFDAGDADERAQLQELAITEAAYRPVVNLIRR
jgi:hypothetical protein